MTPPDHTQVNHTSGNGSRSRRAPVSRRPGQARIQLISDGVVASYIHDISVRHRAQAAGEAAVKQSTS